MDGHDMTRQTPTRQRGVAAVEFSVVAVIFFMLFFGIVDIIRALYICNILQEVTRRATALAVNTDFTDAAAMAQVRTQAVFRTTPGMLAFSDPNAADCIQLVRVRICLPGGASDVCDPVPYRTLASFVPFSFSLPSATTIARAETLGMPPGVPVPAGGGGG
jgi:hypothetical protein